MEKYGFFNDVNDDRIYFSEDFARYFMKYFTNGVFNNELKVTANNDMTVTIGAGDANIEGYRYTNTENLIKNIDNADGTLSRIDNIVLRLDLTNRLISVLVVKGSFAVSPVAPDLVRNTTIYDLRLAKIMIEPGATSITQDNIEDTRFNSSDCGNVVSTVQHLDTEDIFAQYQTAFNQWFEEIKGKLSTDQAGNLQNQIDDINNLLIFDTTVIEVEEVE